MFLSRSIPVLAAAVALGLVTTAGAEDPFPTLGTIERLDSGFDKLIPRTAKLELLEPNKLAASLIFVKTPLPIAPARHW